MSPETGPTVWQAILCDPTVPFDRATLWQVVRDQRRWSRRWLYPWVRVVCRVLVGVIRLVKVLIPLQAHSTMDNLCVWFLGRFVSPEAGALLLRHFVVETNLLSFIVANAGQPGLPAVTLRPTTLAELGNRAVIVHDVNVYDVLIGLGVGEPGQSPPELDFSMLEVPPLHPDESRRRWLNLDIQTALCLMNVPFALCLTPAEYDRAVHSLRLDDSLLAILVRLTGDPTFWRWHRGGITVRIDSGIDVPGAVYQHAVICEFAHERLRQLARSGSARPAEHRLAARAAAFADRP
jgi:hypothetical protein